MGGFDERGLPRSGGAQGNQSKRFGTTTHKHTTGRLKKQTESYMYVYFWNVGEETFEIIAWIVPNIVIRNS